MAIQPSYDHPRFLLWRRRGRKDRALGSCPVVFVSCVAWGAWSHLSGPACQVWIIRAAPNRKACGFHATACIGARLSGCAKPLHTREAVQSYLVAHGALRGSAAFPLAPQVPGIQFFGGASWAKAPGTPERPSAVCSHWWRSPGLPSGQSPADRTL